jgi:hypothetical protein
MSYARKSLLAVAVGCGIGAIVPMALPQGAAAARPTAAAPGPQGERPSHIEGRLAFLKTELKISDAQSAQWNALADVIRQNDRARRQRAEQLRADRRKPMDALAQLQLREQLASARAGELKQFVAAFQPLYATMSDDQKQTANELFGRRHHHGRWHGRS